MPACFVYSVCVCVCLPLCCLRSVCACVCVRVSSLPVGIVCCLCAIIKMLLYFLAPLFIFICKHALCLHTHTHTRASTWRICLFFLDRMGCLDSWEIFGGAALLLLWIMRPLGATYFAHHIAFVFFFFYFILLFLFFCCALAAALCNFKRDSVRRVRRQRKSI